MCKKYGLEFTNNTKDYGIIQNTNDTFQGNKITILYDPGSFPAIFKNSTSTILRNGGIPQRGSLNKHLKVYLKHLNKFIPDINYNGLAVIDFEYWRPIFRQNFGNLRTYKTLSFQKEKLKNVHLNKNQIETRASRTFERAARRFMERTLTFSKSQRPNAKWGYYAFPYCFNNNGSSRCSLHVRSNNRK